mgnify:CR=1 FL=1
MADYLTINAEALTDTIESASAVLKAIYTTFLRGGGEREALLAIASDFEQFDRLLYLAAELVSQAEDIAKDLSTEAYNMN